MYYVKVKWQAFTEKSKIKLESFPVPKKIQVLFYHNKETKQNGIAVCCAKLQIGQYKICQDFSFYFFCVFTLLSYPRQMSSVYFVVLQSSLQARISNITNKNLCRYKHKSRKIFFLYSLQPIDTKPIRNSIKRTNIVKIFVIFKISFTQILRFIWISYMCFHLLKFLIVFRNAW